MKCNGCPFNDGLTEEACMIQNYGCLPDKFSILRGVEKGEIWMCHEHENRVCGGLLEERPDIKGERIKPSEWYTGKTGKNIR